MASNDKKVGGASSPSSEAMPWEVWCKIQRLSEEQRKVILVLIDELLKKV